MGRPEEVQRPAQGPPSTAPPAEAEERVLIFDPYGRNAALGAQALQEANLRVQIAPTIDALLREGATGAGALLLCLPAVDEKVLARLRALLAAQPRWSDLPVLLLVARDAPKAEVYEVIAHLGTGANVTILRKPMWPATLVTAARTALRARQRQYELRDLYATLQERVRQRTATVRGLAAELARAEESERQRISQILHDNLQQMLYGVLIQLQSAESAFVAGERRLLKEDLKEMKETLAEAMHLTRTLTVEMDPPELALADFGAVLASLAAHMKEHYGLEVAVEMEQPWMVEDHTIRLLLFQGVRELLFNVVKHAGVEQATVRLEQREGTRRLTVSDEGSGLEPDKVEKENRGGLGLPRVAERMAILGGKMEFETVPGRGTRVSLLLPAA